MRLSASQLQSQHKALIDASKAGGTVEITYHGQHWVLFNPYDLLLIPGSRKMQWRIFSVCTVI